MFQEALADFCNADENTLQIRLFFLQVQRFVSQPFLHRQKLSSTTETGADFSFAIIGS